ncbi:hypothetical protein GCM10027296_35530 [Chitinimonas naiadis]
MSKIIDLVFFIMNAYSSHPRDPVLIVRYGAIRGAIAFAGPALFLAILAAITKPQVNVNLLQIPALVIVGYISTAFSLAAGFLLLISVAFLLRIIYSYINPAAFDYH